MAKIENLTFQEKLELIKAAPVQLYKGEQLIKLYYSPDFKTRLLVVKNASNLFYYVKEELIIFNEQQLVQVNEGFDDVIYGGYQQIDNGYGYSVFDNLNSVLSELKPELEFYNEQIINS